jgi:hypothetical protein
LPRKILEKRPGKPDPVTGLDALREARAGLSEPARSAATKPALHIPSDIAADSLIAVRQRLQAIRGAATLAATALTSVSADAGRDVEAVLKGCVCDGLQEEITFIDEVLTWAATRAPRRGRGPIMPTSTAEDSTPRGQP